MSLQKDRTRVEVGKSAFDDHCGGMQMTTMDRRIAPILFFSVTYNQNQPH